MKWTTLAFLLMSIMSPLHAHEGIELGPNKGRILDLSSDESLQAEVTEKEGKLTITLLDHDLKAVAIDKQELAATAGTREAPVKVEVEKSASNFTMAAPPAGEWIIFQFKTDGEAKALVVRLHYNVSTCAPCKQPEWRCACPKEEEKEKK